MSAWAAIEIATYIVAVAFGAFAIFRWRRRGASIPAGLGVSIDRGTVADLGMGLLITTAAMIGIFSLELAAGGIRSTGAPFDPVALSQFGLILAVAAFVDEFVMRGMLVSGLALLLGGRALTAVLISAVLFGMTHMMNPGASALSVVSNSLGGVIYGLAFIRTRRIWLGLGLHFAWNFVQGPILGFPVSGHLMGGVLRVVEIGPGWLTGGAYGPEAGAVGIAFRFIIIAAVIAWTKSAHRASACPMHTAPIATATQAAKR